ncbi:hypothetical protein MBLNU459_g1481t1 [Dothideomycetes sp. NU459]
MEDRPDVAFAKALPKVELHAHLTGSISRQCLHSIWNYKKASDPGFELEDPLTAIPHGEGQINIATFFPIFDKFIYNLVNDIPSIQQATQSVLEDFLDDGVAYLELRTTPREIPANNITKQDYVAAVLSTIAAFNSTHGATMKTFLILSVDRRNTLPEALATTSLALAHRSSSSGGGVVGLDLCGNPARAPIAHLAPAFAAARAAGLPLTLHFAEVPAAPPDDELALLLAWRSARLGHVVHVPAGVRARIAAAGLGLELCLSCNVMAGMLPVPAASAPAPRSLLDEGAVVGGGGGGGGGFASHHFGSWWREGSCPIALSTDDVGVFQSALSAEYLLAAEHFGLGRKELVRLGRGAVDCIFGGEEEKSRLRQLWDAFEKSTA